MKFIRSRTQSDCVIAATAMLCGRSYRAVKQTYGSVGRTGIDLPATQWLLGECGLSARLVRLRNPRPLRAIVREFPTALAMIETADFFGERVHAVAIVDGIAFDPSGENSVKRNVVGLFTR